MIILPFAKKIGEAAGLSFYRARSLSEWLRDELPEGSIFMIDYFEVDDDEARAKVVVRLPLDLINVSVDFAGSADAR